MKYLLIISCLLFTPLGWSKDISWYDLEKRDGLYYEKVKNILFTGNINGREKGQIINIPVAHHDGNFFADDETINELENEGRIAFRYCGPLGEITQEFNINGSQNNIAGIYNNEGSILGMMPHPENAIDNQFGGIDGKGLFKSIAGNLLG